MNDKELNELLEYNQEYMEARLSEDIFGGDYTSEVDLKHLEKAYNQLQSNWNSLRECIQDMIYTIEPKGTGINYNCEYDSEEDFIDAMKEQSKLNTLKFVLDKMNELEGVDNENN